MPYRGYMLVLQRDGVKATFSRAELQEVQRILGEHTCPFFAVGSIMGIGFATTDSAAQTLERLQNALGKETRITILELGADAAQYGLPHQNAWFEKLLWLMK